MKLHALFSILFLTTILSCKKKDTIKNGPIQITINSLPTGTTINAVVKDRNSSKILLSSLNLKVGEKAYSQNVKTGDDISISFTANNIKGNVDIDVIFFDKTLLNYKSYFEKESLEMPLKVQ